MGLEGSRLDAHPAPQSRRFAKKGSESDHDLPGKGGGAGPVIGGPDALFL
jgi:hypothetical protein